MKDATKFDELVNRQVERDFKSRTETDLSLDVTDNITDSITDNEKPKLPQWTEH